MTITTSFHDGIAVIELNRPEVLNALNERMLADMTAALDEIDASECRGMVFTGAGAKAFCAGADIDQLRARSPGAHRANLRLGQSTFNRIQQSTLPSVAVIHGFAFGGGLELALACTFRIACGAAKLGLPEVKLGLIPGYGGTQRLPRLIGEARASRLILAGDVIDAAEALRIGLVDRIVEDGPPADRGCAFLAPITKHSKVAVGAAQQAIRRGMDGALDAGLSIEADMFASCVLSRDAAEGMAAFQEKRVPVYTDN
jgi:enoyl-CoA hydratase